MPSYHLIVMGVHCVVVSLIRFSSVSCLLPFLGFGPACLVAQQVQSQIIRHPAVSGISGKPDLQTPYNSLLTLQQHMLRLQLKQWA